MKARSNRIVILLLSALSWGTAARGALAELPLFRASRDADTETAEAESVSSLLRAARDAMHQGNLVEAETFISRAESMGRPLLSNPLADSPAKARRDLEAMKRADRAPERPSQQARPSILSALPGVKSRENVDPFERGNAEVDALLSDRKPQAQVYIRKGREALEAGNLSAANYYQKLAAQAGAEYGADEDSPQKLAEDIQHRGGAAAAAPPRTVSDFQQAAAPGQERRQYSEGGIRPLPPREPNAAEMGSLADYREGQTQNSESRRRAEALLLEARRALAFGDARRAASLIEDARGINAQFGPMDDSPHKVESLIRKHVELLDRQAQDGHNAATRRLQALLLLEQAEALAEWGDYDMAERLAHDAARMRVDYAPFESDPRQVLQRIAALRSAANSDARSVRPASFDDGHEEGAVASAFYDPQQDGSQVRHVNTEEESFPAPPAQPSPGSVLFRGEGDADSSAEDSLPAQAGQALEWIRQGDAALENRDERTALEFYRRAAATQNQLDPAQAQYLSERLQLLQGAVPRVANDTQLLDETAVRAERLRQQVSADVARLLRQARDEKEEDPRAALDEIERARVLVEQSKLTPDEKNILQARVARALNETEQYIERHRSEIELSDRNRQVQGDVDRQQQHKVEVQNRVAQLVDEFNRLTDERRYAEAEVKAKEAREIAPDEPVVQQMWWQVRFVRRVMNNRDLRDDKEEKFWGAMNDVELASVPYGDESNPIRFPDRPSWEALTNSRRKYGKEYERKLNPKEIEIERKLQMPVSLAFRGTPLSQVLEHLKQVSAVNIYVDPQGLAQEGVDLSTPITIDLTEEIMLCSALDLILEPLHLSYVIKNEVLKITSEQHRTGNVYTMVYNVADLVIPIPDFVPHNRVGLPQAIGDGYDRTSANLSAYGFQAPIMSVAAKSVPANTPNPENVLAQASGGMTTGGNRGGTATVDFDGLIDLITKTINPESWDSVGGSASVQPSVSNLSLVISQTQDGHEKIADLLEQLRRLQDLQVTIEVRFITLSDNFFERIGVDFDFNYRGNITPAPDGEEVADPSWTGGLLPATADNPFPNFTPNGEIQYRNNSFAGSVPQFGGFDPASAAQFGIAILSDLEAFFLVQAAQGDTRTNIMQAPKITLFNGQAASISDQAQTPFVTSVTPVVGDFAAAQAPIIVVLNEGTSLSVQAVVSPDRRFVRLTLVPFFSEIGEVKEFRFTGSTTTKKSGSASSSDDGDTTSESGEEETFTEGTTVQLPTFIFTTVTTTVSVPDGGTVLLGGVKRLREGRNELGVPIMSKIPYINRLFKNVGIGREAQSLMLMVTPRIIIQEEEESKIGLGPE